MYTFNKNTFKLRKSALVFRLDIEFGFQVFPKNDLLVVRRNAGEAAVVTSSPTGPYDREHYQEQQTTAETTQRYSSQNRCQDLSKSIT